MTVMRVRASMGESTRIRLVWDRIGHAAAKGLTETPVENQGPEMLFQEVQEFIYSEGIQYGCSMAQAKNPGCAGAHMGRRFSAIFRSTPKFFVGRMSVGLSVGCRPTKKPDRLCRSD